jgi:GR25 family glycosyltransferase involved in LPS biosynthesis
MNDSIENNIKNNIKNNIENVIKNYNVKRMVFINDTTKSIYINRFVDKIYCINLQKDRFRRNYIIKIMEKYGINFELIIVPFLNINEYELISNKKLSYGEAGCYISHMYCYKDSIDNKYNRIIIFEDDIILHKYFHESFEKIQNLEKIDLLILGCSDYHFKSLNCFLVRNNIYVPDKKSSFIGGTHAIFYTINIINNIYDYRINKPTFMDDTLIELFNFGNGYICFPNLAIVDFSTSNINHNLDFFSTVKEDYYLKNCFNNRLLFSEYNYFYFLLFDNLAKIINTKYFCENIKKTITHIIRLYNFSNLEKTKILSRVNFDLFSFEDLTFIIENNI